MQLRRWSTIVLAVALGLLGVVALLNHPAIAQSSDSFTASATRTVILTGTLDVPLLQLAEVPADKSPDEQRVITNVPADLKIHEIDLGRLNVPALPVLEEKEKAALSSDYNAPTGGALGSGHAFMSISPDVVRPSTLAAVATLATGFLPLEPVLYSLNGTTVLIVQASPTGVVAVTFNTSAATGPNYVKGQGLYSGRVAGGVFQVQTGALLAPGLAIAPHAIAPGGSQPLTLMGVGYPASTVITVSRNATAILTTTTNANGMFNATLAVGAGPDASAVYNSSIAGVPGSMAGQSIEERADAGGFGDQNTARAMIDRAVLSGTVGAFYVMVGEDFQPGEFVTISPISANPVATTTADANGAVAFFISTPGGGPAQYHYRYNGITSGRVAYGSAMADPLAFNVPAAIVRPSHSGSGGTVGVLYTKFITAQPGSLIVDGINVGAGGTVVSGIGSSTIAKPITGPLVHSVAFSGTVDSTQIAIAPLLLVGSGTLSGTVTDAINGLPIKATVQIATDGIAQSVPPVGYVLPYQAGTYTATVVASGCYISQTTVVTITADTVTTRNFALARSARDAGGYLCYENAGRAYSPAANLVQAIFDDESITYTLPFSVSFYGVLTNTGSINGNGFATLGATIDNGFFNNGCIPTTTLPNGILGALWDDLEGIGGGSGIYTDVVGLAPHRTFVVEWRNFRHFNDTANVTNTIELQIDEGTGDIYTIYPIFNIGRSDGREATIGIENLAGTVAKPYQCNTGTAFSQETTNEVWAGDSVRYYLPQPLYDQYDNPSVLGTGSQNFEPAFDAFDDFLADDFVVPSDQFWNVDLAEVKGSYFSGVGPARSVNVFFYSNAITTPGTLLATRTDVTYTPGPNPGDFILPLHPPVMLSPGAYWMSVQANQDFTPAGQWAWTDRAITSTHPAVWQNPGGGFGLCPTWNIRTICVGDSAAPDQVFRLSGTRNPLPIVHFSPALYSVNENGGSIVITVTLETISPLTATVNFVTTNGTATAGSDYIANSGTLTFTPGVTSQTLTVTVIDDGLFEENETFNVVLIGATNATIGFPNPAVVTIVDNDPPLPLVCSSGVPGPWVLRNFVPTPVYGAGVGNDGASVYVVGGYSFQTGGDVTQTVRYDPITNQWTPLTSVPNAVIMASTVYAPVNNKLYVFGGEMAGSGQIFSTTHIYDVGGNSWSTGAPLPEVRAFMGSGYYNGKIYLVGGYSTANVTPAYAQTWEYDVLANTWVTKTAMPQALGGPASAVVNGHLYIIGGRDVSSSAITQTYDYDIASDTWFTRTSIPTGVNVPGTAVLGGKVWVIGGGSPFLALAGPESAANISAPETLSTTQIYDPIGDSWSSGPNLNIQRSFVGATGFGNFAIAIGGYNGSTTTGATEVTQNCPGVQFGAPTYSVNESAGSAIITATLNSVSGVTATVNFATSDGTATAGSDYTAATGTLTFAPGQTNRTFTVPILNDLLVEPTESLTVTLSAPSNAALGVPNSTSVSIADDDIYPTVQFNTNNYQVNENAGTAAITVTLSASYPLTATVNFATSDGTATAGSDYTAVTGTLTFAPGQTSRTFGVPIINDLFKEPNETLNLILSGAGNAVLGLPNPATLTIVNDDYALYLPLVLKN